MSKKGEDWLKAVEKLIESKTTEEIIDELYKYRIQDKKTDKNKLIDEKKPS